MAVSFRCAIQVALVLFIGMGLPGRARAQVGEVPDTVQVLPLSELLQGLADNPSLRAARLNAEALAQRRDQVTALPEPTLGVMYQPLPILTARGWQRSQWRAEQAIPFPGKRALQGDVADLGADVADLEADAFLLDLVRDVRMAYYELYRIQEQQRLIEQFQVQLRDFEEVAATRYEVGTGTQQGILKAQLERNRLTERALRLAEERASTLETLARLLNVSRSALPSGEVVVEPTRQDLALTAQLETALAQRPELEALRTAEARAQRQVALAKRAFWPDFSVSLTYFDIAAADMPPTADGRDALMVGAGVKIPLWRDRLRAGLEEARLQRRQAEARTEALETAVRTQLADLSAQLEIQGRQLTLYEETLLPQAQTTLEATLNAYSAGRVSFLDLLDAERTLFQLRTDFEITRARYLKTVTALERALGVTLFAELP